MATPSMAPMSSMASMTATPTMTPTLPEGDPLALPVEKTESDAPSQPAISGNRLDAVLQRTSILPNISKRKFAGAVHLPEVSQCICIVEVVSFWLIICYLVFVG